LAVLGLLAVATLGNRFKFEEGLRQLTESPSELFQEKHAARLEADLAQAGEVWLVGVTLSRTIKTNYSLFEHKLARGDTIRILLVDPKGVGAEMAAGREYGGRFDAERIRNLIQGSLSDLCSLKQLAPDRLQVRVIDNPLTFGGIAINPNATAGILYLEHYSYKMPGGSVPKFVLGAKDGRWYYFFKEEMQTLWKNGAQWACMQ
jgi:hypothetical protein